MLPSYRRFQALRRRVVACAFLVAALATAFSGGARADYLEDVGYAALEAMLGAATPDGTGIGVAQVEFKDPEDDYLPQPGTGSFAGTGNLSGKTLTAGSPGGSGSSGHAADVAAYFFGNNTDPLSGPASMAPGVSVIECFSKGHYITGAYADARDRKVHSNAWIDPTISNAVLIAVDEEVENYGNMVVTGLANGPGTVPALLASGYNILTVGRSDGVHSGGFTPATVAGEGRVKPDVVAPYTATSWSVGGVSSLATILYDAADGNPIYANAFDEAEVMKAIVMAGATKDEFPGWSRTGTVPLDTSFGAGEVNVYESYQILTAGEQASGGAIAARGWDFGELPARSLPPPAPGPPQDYTFTIPPGMSGNEVNIMLTWNRTGPEGTVHDLNLQLLDLAETTEWDASRSAVDNVEHVHYRNLPAGDFVIRISRKGDGDETTPYGLAWRMEVGQGPEIEVTPAGPDNELSLSQLDPLIEYTVERSIDGGMSWTPLQTFTPAGTTHLWTDAGGGGPGVTYRVDWTPRDNGPPPPPDDGGPGDPGPGPGEKDPPRPCETPGFPCPGIDVIRAGGSEIEIANLQPGVPCVIQRSRNLVTWKDVHEFTPVGTEFSWTDEGPGGGTEYFRLKSEADGGASDVEFTVTPPAGTMVNLSGLETGTTYRVERTHDLVNWVFVHLFTATGPTEDWLNEKAGGPCLYYRLSWVIPASE